MDALKSPDTSADSAWVPTATFCSIPPELRTRIYEYVLADPLDRDSTKITIVRHKKRRPELYQRKPTVNRSVKDGGEYDSKTKSYIPVKPRTAILCVSKEIYSEAIVVLYGRKLIFRSFSELRDILPLIGEGKKHLRDIEIRHEGYNPTLAKKVFTGLSTSKGLRKIKLNHGDFCKVSSRWAGAPVHNKQITIDALVKDVTPLLKVLKVAYKESGRNWNVLDVVEFVPGTCQTCDLNDWFLSRGRQPYKPSDPTQHNHELRVYISCECRCSEVGQKNAVLQARLRSALAEKLGISDGADAEGV